MIKIDAEELILALEDNNPESKHFLDLETGAVEFIMDEFASEFEDESLLDEDGEMPEKYLPIDPVPSHTGFNIMRDFIETIENPRVARDLEWALSQRHPFRTFKSKVDSHTSIRQQWFKYHDERFLELARKWLHDNNIQAELTSRVV